MRKARGQRMMRCKLASHTCLYSKDKNAVNVPVSLNGVHTAAEHIKLTLPLASTVEPVFVLIRTQYKTPLVISIIEIPILANNR